MNGRFCASCGRRPVGETCCWFQGLAGDPEPHELVPGVPWEEWNADEQFLITLLMERFGGAAEEWELLCRLPWRGWRLEQYTCDCEERPDGAGAEFACFRERDERDRGRRCFLSDLARNSYALHQREEAAEAAFMGGFPFGRYPGRGESAGAKEEPR